MEKQILHEMSKFLEAVSEIVIEKIVADLARSTKKNRSVTIDHA